MQNNKLRGGLYVGSITVLAALALNLLPINIVATAYATDKTAQTVQNYQPSSTYLSPVKTPKISFTGVGLNWHEKVPSGTKAQIYVRFLTNNNWSDWNFADGDYDNKEASDETKSAFLSTPTATSLQYKVILETSDSINTPRVDNLEITYLNAKDEQTSNEPYQAILPVRINNTKLTATTSDTLPTVKIITRQDWGADESLRINNGSRPDPKLIPVDPDYVSTYADEMKIVKTVDKTDDGKNLTWSLTYPEKVSKIIIHHTATTKDLDNPKQAIRNIYYWHAISKGWGDIGYNYIIDPQGNIYEGRAGGDGVVGGHAGKSNVGSIGIAILGNYQDNEVPDAVVKALAALINEKATKFGIDPTGTSVFRGENIPNVLGHRDVMATTCPGDKLYALIPAIRQMAKSGLVTDIIDRRRNTSDTQYDYTLQNRIPIIEMDPATSQNISITIKNTGTKPWGSGTMFMVSTTEGAQYHLDNTKNNQSSTLNQTISTNNTATFNLNITASNNGGLSTIEVFPLIDGKIKLEKYISIPIKVKAPSYNYQFVQFDISNTKLKPGQTVDATLTLKNTGETTWKNSGANKIMIGTDNPHDHVYRLAGSGTTRIAGMNETEVAPGNNGTFTFHVKAPTTAGLYREYYAPVIEGIKWLDSKNLYLEIEVLGSGLSAKFIGSADTLQTIPLERKQVTYEFQNNGDQTWTSDNIKFQATAESPLRVSIPLVSLTRVYPGQSAQVSLLVASPPDEGIYNFKITPISNGKTVGAAQTIFVKVAKNSQSDSTTVSQTKPQTTTSPSNTSNTNGQPTGSSTVNQVSVNQSNDSLKVAISFKGDPVISATGKFNILDSGKVVYTFEKDEKVAVKFDRTRYQIKGNKTAFVLNNPPRFEPVGNAILRIDNYENRPAWNQSYNDNQYRGALIVSLYNNALVVINDINLEDYLKGIAEISAKDPYEKIKAVIVLARTYAKFYTSTARKFPDAPFDLTDDPERSQKYLGYSFETRNQTGVKAVNDTAGIFVTYNGKLIKTPYFSADDGKTKSAQAVWGWTDTPYLVSVDDPGCKGLKMSGHGVGLSGCGALYFAQKGYTYDQIIKYYFKGVTVSKIK